MIATTLTGFKNEMLEDYRESRISAPRRREGFVILRWFNKARYDGQRQINNKTESRERSKDSGSNRRSSNHNRRNNGANGIITNARHC